MFLRSRTGQQDLFQRTYDTHYFTSQVRTGVLFPKKLLSLLNMPGEQSCCNPQWHGPTRRIWLLMVIKQLVSSTLYIHISNRVRSSRAPVLSHSTQDCQMGDGLYPNLRWTELKINTSHNHFLYACFSKPTGCYNILLQGCIKNNIKSSNSLGLGLLSALGYSTTPKMSHEFGF